MGWLAKFLSGNYLVPALDIGTSSVKLLQFERKGGAFKVKNFSKLEYREQAFVGTEILDEEEVVNVIKELYSSLGIKEKDVIVHVPLAACFYNVISVPPNKNPEEAVVEYMKSIISPEEFPNVKIDYRVLPVSAGKEHIDIAVAAVKKDDLNERIRILKRANLTPVVVDIEAAALNNQYYLNYPENLASPVCLVDIGASFTKVVVSFGGYPYTTRNIELGGINITEQLQKEFMLTFEEAEKLKLGEEIREISYEKAFDVIKGTLRKIFTEIMWTLDNFKERFGLEVNSVHLYGGSAKLKGIREFLKEITGLEVKVESPLGFSGISGNQEFAVAAGLAMRYRGDEDAKV